jgi:hypothetical protein
VNDDANISEFSIHSIAESIKFNRSVHQGNIFAVISVNVDVIVNRYSRDSHIDSSSQINVIENIADLEFDRIATKVQNLQNTRRGGEIVGHSHHLN